MLFSRRTLLGTAAGLPWMLPAFAQGALELVKPGELSACTEGTFPPFSMSDARGQLDGLEIRLMRAIAAKLNLTYRPIVQKWESTLVGLEAGQYDLASTTMDITEERQKAVVFVDGWLESGSRVLVRRAETAIARPADLRGRTVGVLVASTYAKAAEELGASIRNYRSEPEAYQDLVNGNVQAVITEAIAGAFAIKSANLPLRMLDEPVSRVQKGWPVKKGKPNLVLALNGALAAVQEDGTYARIMNELIGFDPRPASPIRSILS
jgi:polar amino acid transport system substrate-binding protein